MNESLMSTSCEPPIAACSDLQQAGRHLFTNVRVLLVLRWSAGQQGGEASIRGHVDLQRGSLRGGRCHGDGGTGLSDPPGQEEREEEEGTPEAD